MAAIIVLFTLRLLTRSIILSVISLMGLRSKRWSSVDCKWQEKHYSPISACQSPCLLSAKGWQQTTIRTWLTAAGNKSHAFSWLNASIEAEKRMADWQWGEELTRQTWISLLAENEGSQFNDTECSKEKFFTTYNRLSCLHTSSTVRPWMGWRSEPNVKNTHRWKKRQPSRHLREEDLA